MAGRLWASLPAETNGMSGAAPGIANGGETHGITNYSRYQKQQESARNGMAGVTPGITDSGEFMEWQEDSGYHQQWGQLECRGSSEHH